VARKSGDKKKSNKKAMQKQSGKKQLTKRQPRGIRLFFRETAGELRKVSWPTRKEALNLTRVVVLVMIVMALFLGGIDFVFFRLFGLLFGT
jgi:preprotein translocase subunit SecE